MLAHFYPGLALLFSAPTADGIPEGSILQFDKSLLVHIGIQWFNVLLLTAVLVWVLYKPVRAYMHNRAARIKNDIESARQNNEQALALKTQYEEMIKNIEKEREDLLIQAHNAAVEKREQLLSSAYEEIKHLQQKAEEDIQTAREQVAADIKKQIADLSLLIATRFVEVSIDAKTQARYIEDALANWPANGSEQA